MSSFDVLFVQFTNLRIPLKITEGRASHGKYWMFLVVLLHIVF
jgi:hypothetical protein